MKFSTLERIRDKQHLDDSEIIHLLPYHRYFARVGDTDTILRMIEAAEDSTEKQLILQNSIIEASKYGQLELIKTILDNATSFHASVKKLIRHNDFTPVRFAIWKGHEEVTDYLIDAFNKAVRDVVGDDTNSLKERLRDTNLKWASHKANLEEEYVPLDLKLAFADPNQPNQLPPALEDYSTYGFDAARYNELLDLCMLRCELKGYHDGAEKRAYNASVLFGSVETIDRYLEATDYGKPSHTYLDFDLPKGEVIWNIEAWRELTIAHGYRIYPYLRYADKIEAKHAEIFSDVALEDLSAEQIEQLACHALYVGAEQNIEAAKVAAHLNLTQEQFDETVRLLKKACPKEADSTPDIHIDGADIGKPGFTMEKVPKDSAINLWVGGYKKIKNCCKIGAVGNDENTDGKELAIAQSHWTDLSLYVVRNAKGNICAKLSGWVKDDRFVFNSWQSHGDKYQHLMLPFITQAAIQIIEENPSIKAVNIGKTKSAKTDVDAGNIKHSVAESGGWIPTEAIFIDDSDIPNSVLQDADCKVQMEITSRERLDETKSKLESIVENLTRSTSSQSSSRNWF
ncbi:MAG: ankyrin repeat domain-containing protein [Rickettsiales bacterium]